MLHFFVESLAARALRSLIVAFVLVAVSALPLLPLSAQTPQRADRLTVDVVRDFGGELFRLNSVPYLNPLVQLLNSMTNARFYHSAEVARKNSFYVRVGVHGMLGFVNPDQFTFEPQVPRAELNIEHLGRYVTIFPSFSIRDTAGLAGYAMRVVINDGVRDGQIQLPSQSATFFGNIQQRFTLPKEYFRQRLMNPALGDPLLLVPAEARMSILPAIENLPDDFPLPNGQNLSSLPLAVPQIEIGSFAGTELLVRFIPQLNWGNNVGNFGFWAVGLKHSLSQYWQDAPLELALQAVYQSTLLTNTIGVTGAKLRAEASIFNANLHASKRWGDFELYGGAAFDFLGINASYTFTIPFEVQAQLGLLKPVRDGSGNIVDYVVDKADGYPGDEFPQTESVSIPSSAFRFTLGAAYYLGPVALCIDYNRSSINLLSGGVTVRF
jgi:hypothetical protein